MNEETAQAIAHRIYGEITNRLIVLDELEISGPEKRRYYDMLESVIEVLKKPYVLK